MAIVSSKSFELVNAKTRQQKGPLVTVEISPGRHVKMYQADAEEQGLIQKSRPAAEDKSLKPAEDKRREGPSERPGERREAETTVPQPSAPADDLTEIDGVGKATARALAAAGIVTFEQLKTADIERIVSGNALAAIEEWRSSNG